jgi:hypothetical protein
MFNSVKKVNISAANIRTNFQISKYFCGNVTSFLKSIFRNERNKGMKKGKIEFPLDYSSTIG